MAIYVCSICGFTYDESKGLPELGIAPGTRFVDLPPNFECPLCGAPKDAIILAEDKASSDFLQNDIGSKPISDKALSNELLTVIFGNLAKGYEKMYLMEEAKLAKEISLFFDQSSHTVNLSLNEIYLRLNKENNVLFPNYNANATEALDRGALRALTWALKVSKLDETIMKKFQDEGPNFLVGKRIYVCEICGYMYIGDNLPKVCPVCKVPNTKLLEVTL